ncbi:hypothetical protein H8J17_26235 [Serratia fonticola]|nr:hypothetical protein [Serratia fonticola]
MSTRNQKSKNPDNLLISWRERKINGAHSKLYRCVALCREYSFMLRKVQYLLCTLLRQCNLSAGLFG